MNTIPNWQNIMQQMAMAKRLYFIGIGGISVSGLAELSVAMGFICAGSDATKNNRIATLERLGVVCHTEHNASNLQSFAPDVVIYSRAIARANPELVIAKALGCTCLTRDEFLGWMNRHHDTTINVAGTNGKTTTTAMVSTILLQADLDPTVHLGAELDILGSTVRLGNKRVMVSEACEFKKSFHSFSSQIATVLNLEHDHVDCYPTMADVREAFAEFVRKITPGGELVIPTFDPEVQKLLLELASAPDKPLSDLKIISFGPKGEPSWTEEMQNLGAHNTALTFADLCYENGLPHFKVYQDDSFLGDFKLSIPGRFNIDNALAAIACTVASRLALPIVQAQAALASFKGAEGRFTETGSYNGARIIADYAHHPSSIVTTLEACAKLPHKRLIAAFQPITHSRAEGLAAEFIEALTCPYPVDIVEIYDNRETGSTFSSAEIARGVNANGGHARFHKTPADLEAFLRKHILPGDLVILMGQDVRQVANNLTGRQP